MSDKNRLGRRCGATAIAAVALLLPIHDVDGCEVTITGTVAATDLTRGPFVDAEVGDPVSIVFEIMGDEDIGVGDLHRYQVTGYTLTVDGVPMTPTIQPTFGFATFSTFHGFDNTSTGLLLPGGGADHNYSLPVFGASGSPTIWLPQGSEPADHPGSFGAKLFDVFNENAVVDAGAGGLGISQELNITLEGITLDEVSGCPADIDGCGAVSFSDLLLVLSMWGPCPDKGPCPADIDTTGTVDFADLLEVITAWGPCS